MSPTETATTVSRRERERHDRRRQILEAARHAFAGKGYAGATLEEIAAAAEFGKGTLYNYFPGGKEEILFAIFDELYDELHAITLACFPPSGIANPEEVKEHFALFIRRCFEYYEQRAELFLILTKEAYRMVFSENQERVDYFMAQRERMISSLAPQIQAGIAAGIIQQADPRAVAHMILGNIQGYQMHRCIRIARPSDGRPPIARPAAGPGETNYQDPPAEEAARFLTSMLFDGLLVRPLARQSGSHL